MKDEWYKGVVQSQIKSSSSPCSDVGSGIVATRHAGWYSR